MADTLPKKILLGGRFQEEFELCQERFLGNKGTIISADDFEDFLDALIQEGTPFVLVFPREDGTQYSTIH